jgi:hypothetical protein
MYADNVAVACRSKFQITRGERRRVLADLATNKNMMYMYADRMILIERMYDNNNDKSNVIANRSNKQDKQPVII